jgi:iron complex outermembrane receptor protein
LPAAAQDAAAETVIVTGSGAEQRVFDTPYAVGVVDAAALRSAGPMVNFSEVAGRIPGLVVNLRNNYAQDLQISSRGFGARASFGVRGIRLYADGIPAAGPDGQGQISHFDLAGAERVEVLRGPFSALYGNGSGGVISLISAAPTERVVALDGDVGSFGLHQVRLGVAAPLEGGFNLRASVSAFEIDRFRPHSEAQRTLGNLRLGWDGERDRVVMVVNSLDQPAQDPLGLNRAAFDADPDQTASIALPQDAPGQPDRYNTRKESAQTQAGVQWQHRFADAGALQRSAVTLYLGQRSVTQWQAISPATQANPRHPGGVIDFDRDYAGIDARLAWRWEAWRLVAGASYDQQQEDRRGYENFVGSGSSQLLGVTGRLRRDEDNRASAADVYAQVDADLGAELAAGAGLRRGRLRVRSADRYLSNGDDSGSLDFDYTTPVLSLRWQPAAGLSAYVSVGRGSETPTLNELAYRPDGGSGFNTDLKAQTSAQLELGLKWRVAGVVLDGAVFRADTENEIGVLTNSGGRSTFQNVGRTRRQGLELALDARLAPDWRVRAAATVLDARYRDPFLSCAGVPCLAPTVPVPAGNRVAGTLPRSAFVEAVWTHGLLELAAEASGRGPQPVNDANFDFAGGYGLLALRALWRVPLGGGRLELLARLDNLLDRRVAGSVIVNESNQRFFEPAAARNGLLSVRWAQPF